MVHYARQSHGVAQVYRRKGLVLDDTPRWLQQATFYAVPLWGILYRSATAPGQFLGMEFRAIPVPLWLANSVGVIAIGLLLWWIVGRIRATRDGRLPFVHTAYLASHFAVFIVGYWLIPTLDHGWLIVNIWHNTQYLLFVWLFNRGRFKSGVVAEARLLSWTVQPGRAWAYFGLCAAISTIVYVVLGQTAAAIAASTKLPMNLIVFQAVNFYHYIADAMIWKIRKAPIRATLALNG